MTGQMHFTLGTEKKYFGVPMHCVEKQSYVCQQYTDIELLKFGVRNCILTSMNMTWYAEDYL